MNINNLFSIILRKSGFTVSTLAGFLFLGSSDSALAVLSTPPTVACTGQCQTCIEFEAIEGGSRCTKCGIAPECLGDPNDPGPTSDFTEILNAHNRYRSKHCAPALTWSPELAKGAQEWANACTPDPQFPDRFAHSKEAWTDANGYGENLYWGTNATANDAVDWWYNEVNQYNFDNPVFSNSVGHFTQLVWQNSKQIGCGLASCGGLNFWVCRYSPPGNWNVQVPGVLAANVLKGCPP